MTFDINDNLWTRCEEAGHGDIVDGVCKNCGTIVEDRAQAKERKVKKMTLGTNETQCKIVTKKDLIFCKLSDRADTLFVPAGTEVDYLKVTQKGMILHEASYQGYTLQVVQESEQVKAGREANPDYGAQWVMLADLP